MTELQKAIERLNKAIDDMIWQDAWDAFQEVCQLLAAIVPGFVCPFAETENPTLAEMEVYGDQWEEQYCQGAGGG
jgi:hypothetical protein